MTKVTNSLTSPLYSPAKSEFKTNRIDYDKLAKVNLFDCRQIEEEFKQELKILEKSLAQIDFGIGNPTIGSELEMPIVDQTSLLPSMTNLEICNYCDSKEIQPEISKFCLEYNGSIIDMSNQPLNTLASDTQFAFDNLNKITTEKFNAKLVTIGILPTLTISDLGMDALTPYWRYYSIDKILRELRCKDDFIIDIGGDDPLHLKWYNTVLEGVNSSYQVHLRVNPKDYNDYYNATQLASAFVLAISGNSPLLFGHRLWEESRIAVFEQTVNNHNRHLGSWQEQPRVSFGRGWIKEGLLGLFKEICELYYPIFPIIDKSAVNDNQFDKTKTGPDLSHLMQHNSTIWTWNRPVYGRESGGHFRIEMRYLPSGPTIADMVMNTGFMLGLTKALSKNINNIITDMPFKYAQYNFYQAAQYGLNAGCIWPDANSKIANEVNIRDLLPDMIKLAGEGLLELGATELEVGNMCQGLTLRLETNLTGARWQRLVYSKFIEQDKLNPRIALKKMLKLYIDNQNSGLPVAMWNINV